MEIGTATAPARAEARGTWLRDVALEGLIVTLLLVVAGYAYLAPASFELLRGNARVMVGDGSDSLTIPWQYQQILDVLHARPQDLLFGAVYTNQINAPEGAGSFIPFIERLFVVGLAPFLRTDLMPTAVVWGLMVLSGLCFHAFGRVLGWPRAVAFALALAWAFSPHTRARAVVHNVMVGTYWAPLVLLALYVLARPPGRLSTRGSLFAAAGMLLFAVFAAHYYVMIAAIMAPAFLLYYVALVPRSASRVAATWRLAAAAAPAALFVLWSIAMPVPSYGARALRDVVAVRSETDQMLANYGAHPSDYVLGDLKFGDRDLLPARAKLTRGVMEEVRDNRHERTNGIRWSVLAACAGLGVMLASRRLRRRLSPLERTLGLLAFAVGGWAFAFSLSPQGLRVYDVDLGPIQLVAKVFPRFRVPNRIGVVVHLAALLGAGVFVSHFMKKHLGRRSARAAALGVALPALAVLDYAPLHPVKVAPIPPVLTELEAQGGCGAGMTVPFTTWAFHDEDYYDVIARVRSTSCQVLHTAYLTREDEIMRVAVALPAQQGDRAPAVNVARCAGASWFLFRLDLPEERRRAFCADMGWSFVGPDACRAPAGTPLPRPRSLRECVDELHLTVPPPPAPPK